MNKFIPLAIVSIGAMGVLNTVSANTGEVQFIGAVTDTTCVINPEVDGLIKSTIQLGTMKPDGSNAKEVFFNLVPETADCLSKTHASVGWQSAGFDVAGLSNMKGDATGASITLTAINSKPANEKVTANKQNITFGSATDTAGIGAFQFKAQLSKTGTAAATAGTVISSAAYAVAYK